MKFWELFFKLFEEEKNILAELDNNPDNSISKTKKILYEKEYHKILGYLIVFLSNVFSKEIIYKKAIKELITNYSKNLEVFLNECVRIFNYSKRESIYSYEEQEIQTIEDEINRSLLETTVIKSLSIIFSKIILVSDLKYLNIRLNNFSKSIFYFLEKNIINFISSFKINIDYSFFNDLNRILLEDRNYKDYNMIPGQSNQDRISNFNINDPNFLGSRQNIINIKSCFKDLNLNEEENFFGVIDSVNKLNYSFNYWIDLKELYILMRTKNYDMQIYFEFFDKIFEYNLAICKAESKVNALISISYLIGIMSSIGFSETLSTSYLFSDSITLKLANTTEKKLVEEIISRDKDTFQKVSFDLINTLFNSNHKDFLKFIEEKFFDIYIDENKNILDYNNQNIPNIYKNEKNFYQINNFYNQYKSYKYDILQNIVDFLKNLYYLKHDSEEEINKNKSPLNFGKIHEIIIKKILTNLNEDLIVYLKCETTEEIEKCIFSIVNTIHSIFTFFVVSNYKIPDENELNLINNIVNTLIFSYDTLSNFNNTIVLIICSYMNLTCELDFIRNDKMIGNYIPLLDYNNLNNNDFNIIRIIMKKLKPNISNANFLIILQFLNMFVKSYGLNAIEIILNEKIILGLTLNDPFENSFTLSEYEENERGTKHLLWCWTWTFFKNILLVVSENENNQYNSVYSLIIEFIQNHDRRVLSVLSNTEFIDPSGNNLQKSLAYIEELECITNVFNLLYLENKKWKNSFGDFYIKNILIIIEKSLKLFVPNIKISNHFKCYSNYEHRMNEVFYFF